MTEAGKIDAKKIAADLIKILKKENLSVSDALRILDITKQNILTATKLRQEQN